MPMLGSLGAKGYKGTFIVMEGSTFTEGTSQRVQSFLGLELFSGMEKKKEEEGRGE